MEVIGYLEVKGINFLIRHCANSAGIFVCLEMHLDIVRANIVLYGSQSSNVFHNPGELKSVMGLKKIIDHVKSIQFGVLSTMEESTRLTVNAEWTQCR